MCISLSFCLVCESKPVGLEFYPSLRAPAAIRSSWRVRRRSRGQRRRSTSGEITGSGHDTEKFSVGDVQRSDEPPHQENLYAVLERSSNQRRVREPPVIIGDPTVSLFLGDWVDARDNAVDLRMDVSPTCSVFHLGPRIRTCSLKNIGEGPHPGRRYDILKSASYYFLHLL